MSGALAPEPSAPWHAEHAVRLQSDVVNFVSPSATTPTTGVGVGVAVGEAVGVAVGDAVGVAVGEAVGESEGDAVGDAVGVGMVLSIGGHPIINPAKHAAVRIRIPFCGDRLIQKTSLSRLTRLRPGAKKRAGELSIAAGAIFHKPRFLQMVR
jgi:hypothetical protein